MRVLIAGGGTGGHVYPALAIAKAIKRADPTHQVEFVGTGSGLEVKLVPREGFQLHTVAIGKVNNVSWGEKLRTLVSLPVSFWQSYRILRRFKPDAVIGVGGYASFPMVWIA